MAMNPLNKEESKRPIDKKWIRHWTSVNLRPGFMSRHNPSGVIKKRKSNRILATFTLNMCDYVTVGEALYNVLISRLFLLNELKSHRRRLYFSLLPDRYNKKKSVSCTISWTRKKTRNRGEKILKH